MRSRLFLRLLSVALLVLFLPVAGIWSLGRFERELLQAEERTMSAQARDVAAWLARSEPFDAAVAAAVLAALERPLAGRIRVIAADGATLADTAASWPGAPPSKLGGAGVRDRPLYRLGALLWRIRGLIGLEPARGAGEPTDDGPAVAAALAGRYGALTRESEDGSDTVMTVAVPIHKAGAVAGAVALSRTTDTALAALDRIRIDLFRVVLLSLAATTLLVLLLARGLVVPLLKLRDAAARPLPGRRAADAPIPGLERRDEIGDLARALADLRERLERRVGELEAFASDVAHEVRNPLAAVRSAAELLPDSASDAERHRLAAVVRSEAARIDRIVSALQELARLDAQRPGDESSPVDLGELVERVAAVHRERSTNGAVIEVRLPEGAVEARIAMSEEAATRVVENLLENALAFSPPAGVVELAVEPTDGGAELVVSDQGPGVPVEHRERIFDRFFSWRPQEPDGRHLGLGLAIARALVRRHGGEIGLAPGVERFPGARFFVRWPAA
jgi:two-component system sensor histidine kinase ChvG